MNDTKRFVIEISSNLDYEEMIANILYNEETVAIVSQDQGIEKMEIEILPSEENASWKLPFSNFMEALANAKKALFEMQKFPDSDDD